MAAETEVVFPRSLSDIYPAAAQQVYIETYKKSFATSDGDTRDRLSRESVASRDAWDAVGREFVQDSVTHKFHRIGEQAAVAGQGGKKSLLGTVKGLFKR